MSISSSQKSGMPRQLFCWIAIVALWIAANAYAIYYIRSEHTLYTYDSVGYWSAFIDTSEGLVHNFGKTVKLLYSIRGSDYNHLWTVLMAPLYWLFGGTRTGYILMIVNGLAIPSALCFAFLLGGVGRRERRQEEGDSMGTVITGKPLPIADISSVLVLFTVLTFPAFWRPVITGMIDVGGTIPIYLLLYLCLKKPLIERGMWSLVSIGLLLAILPLYRRWYIIWVAGFILAALFDSLIASILAPGNSVKARLKIIARGTLNVEFVALVCVGLLLLVATPLLVRMVGINYADLYSPYQLRDARFSNIFLSFVKYFGALPLGLALLGFLIALFRPSIRRFAIVLGVQFLGSFLIFTHIQDFNPHHYYLVIPAILFFYCYFIVYTYGVAQKIRTKVGILVASVFLSLFSFSIAFFSQMSSYREAMLFILPGATAYPSIISAQNMKENIRMEETLSQLVNSPTEMIYVLPNLEVSAPILKYLYLSLGKQNRIRDNVLATQILDKRDGFPSRLFEATYVVVTDPLLHLHKDEDVQIIILPAKLILSGVGIGLSYQRLPYDFTFENGVKAYIYKRVLPFKKADVVSFSEMLRKLYPDRENIFDIKLNPKVVVTD